jgi:hypothetical protein
MNEPYSRRTKQIESILSIVDRPTSNSSNVDTERSLQDTTRTSPRRLTSQSNGSWTILRHGPACPVSSFRPSSSSDRWRAHLILHNLLQTPRRQSQQNETREHPYFIEPSEERTARGRPADFNFRNTAISPGFIPQQITRTTKILSFSSNTKTEEESPPKSTRLASNGYVPVFPIHSGTNSLIF